MKYIVRILVSAFAFISAAACYNNEIENPDNPQNPEQSGLSITATMAKTRVSFGNEDSNNIYPEWEEGDILFGFYGDDPDDNGIVLMVSGVNEGVAELEIVSGELANQNVETSVCLIYTGCNEEDLSGEIDPDEFKFSEGGTFTVDLTSQNLDHIPVCMSASAEIEDGSDGEKTLSFGFTYDCAVLEVETLAGFGEIGFEAGSLTGVVVSGTGVSFKGKYSYNEGIFTFIPITGDSSYSQSLTDWSASSDGNMECSGETKKILISAIPTSEGDISISYNRDGTPICSETFSNRTLEEGNCYVIRHNYVAKTSDNYFFETVAAAFEHAAVLGGTLGTGVENTVTLVKKIITGFGTPKNATSYDGEIKISYDVTLDLNGCTLSLNDTNEYFDVEPVNDDSTLGFTIMDSISGGKIISNSADQIIDNYGTVYICGGSLEYKANGRYSCIYNNADASLFISGGTISSQYKDTISNDGYIEISDNGKIESVDGKAVTNWATIIIKGGELFSENSYALYGNGFDCSLDVQNGYFHNSSSFSVIYCDYSEGGYMFSMSGGRVVGNNNSAIELTGDGDATVSGGYLESSSEFGTLYIHDGPQCTISGGTICNMQKYDESEKDGHPAIWLYKNSSLTVTWPKNVMKEENTDYYITKEGKYEPLIYSCASGQKSSPIRKAFGGNQEKEISSLEIIGGYLISTNNAFYSQESGTEIGDPMDYNYFNNLFTNCPALFAASGSSDELIHLNETHSSYSDYSAGNQIAGCDFDTISSTSYGGYLYKITGPAPSGASEVYNFSNFGW